MYPIHSPLITPPATLLALGPMEQSVGAALNCFTSQKSGLNVPLITANWRVNGMNLGSSDTETVLTSLRRLSDAGEMLSNYYRELDSRASSSASSISQKLDMTQIHKIRLQDLLAPTSRKRDSQPTIGRGQWRLAACEKGQGVAYINEDGQALHIRSVSGANAVLGYGWAHSIMHYLGIDVKSPTGRSVALFENKELHSSEWSISSFRDLIQSLLGIDLSAQDNRNAKLIIEGSDSRQQPVSWAGSATDEGFLHQSFRGISFAKDFSIATEDLANGTRNPAFRSINPPIPKASFRYLAAEGRVLLSLYRGEGIQSAEIGLSPDQRSRLYFPKSPARPSSRPPSRVP